MRTIESNGFLYPETSRLYERLASYEPVHRLRKQPYWHQVECHTLALLLALAEVEHGGPATEEALEKQLHREAREVLESAERLLKGNGVYARRDWFDSRMSIFESAMIGIRAKLKKMREEKDRRGAGSEKESALV